MQESFELPTVLVQQHHLTQTSDDKRSWAGGSGGLRLADAHHHVTVLVSVWLGLLVVEVLPNLEWVNSCSSEPHWAAIMFPSLPGHIPLKLALLPCIEWQLFQKIAEWALALRQLCFHACSLTDSALLWGVCLPTVWC